MILYENNKINQYIISTYILISYFMKINKILIKILRKLFICRSVMEYLEFRLFRKIFYFNYSKILDFHLFYLQNYSYLLSLDFIYKFLQNFFV